jgi:peptidoglycan/xylan/chitin deacetylase (PgdA/CDA1 family)
MYLVKSPWWLKKLYPALTWNIATEEKEVYLTFDDGPHQTITPFVLDALKQHNAKATFFCIGKNVKEHPAIYERIISEGHKVGNHTFNHYNGWKTSDDVYIKDILAAKEYIDSDLFRPPYGRITKFQIQQLKSLFRIVMWDVLSADFDTLITPQKSLEHVTSNVSPGSIVVFHDSQKAFPRLEYALPKTLDYLSENGFTYRALS